MKFTWHNGQLGNSAIMKKLDWIFGNSSFLNSWPVAHSQFLPRDHSDHSSMVLTLSTPLPHSPAPFKFLNVWADREDFLDIVKSVWESPIHGTPIYSFTAKLRLLKHSLKTLHRHHTSHISSRVHRMHVVEEMIWKERSLSMVCSRPIDAIQSMKAWRGTCSGNQIRWYIMSVGLESLRKFHAESIMNLPEGCPCHLQWSTKWVRGWKWIEFHMVCRS